MIEPTDTDLEEFSKTWNQIIQSLLKPWRDQFPLLLGLPLVPRRGEKGILWMIEVLSSSIGSHIEKTLIQSASSFVSGGNSCI